jgi:hypothetical protein
MTLREALLQALRQSGARHGPEEAAAVAVLWPDRDRSWEVALPALQADHPALLSLGPYDAASRTGPAIWLRCMLARVLEAAGWSPSEIPVLYLPGVGRADLRTAEDSPRELQPLLELQYRGVLWSHPNGKDWTIAGFLSTLGLDVAQDEETRRALQERLRRLLDTDLDDLKTLGRLDSMKIRNLGSDWPVEILAWMEKPAERGEDWSSFRAACQSQYGFDPQTDGELAAAEHLAQATGAWFAVWSRFAHAPRRYPGVVALLRKVVPPDLFAREEGYPSKNREAEEQLRDALAKAAGSDPAAARQQVLALEQEHGCRRKWVWAELGDSPLAVALQPLARCAWATATPLAGTVPEEMVRRYAEGGWEADQAACRSYAAVETLADTALIRDVLRTLYLPWLEVGATAFAGLCAASPLRNLWRPPGKMAPGQCLLFADGLRFDVGRLLEERLSQEGMEVELSPHVCALPGVTPTAKPAVSPVARELTGSPSGAEFRPVVTAIGKPLHVDLFRDLLSAAGVQPLAGSQLGDPTGGGWVEAGALDRMGHDEGARMARRIVEEVRMLAERVRDLLDAGWTTVHVVTDHGWLWMPGGLPKTDFPAYVAETRWGRCAALKGSATTGLQTIPWHWEPSVSVVVAPGISCFKANLEYAHGGLSVQECVVPYLVVRRPAEVVAARIESVKWTGLVCRIKASGAAGLRADLRTKRADPASSVALGVKPLDAEGGAVLYASDDDEGNAVMVVLLDAAGAVVAHHLTTVGG